MTTEPVDWVAAESTLVRQRECIKELQRKLANRNREVSTARTRIAALKAGAPDPAMVENINCLHARLVGQREEINALLAERNEARTRVKALEGALAECIHRMNFDADALGRQHTREVDLARAALGRQG